MRFLATALALLAAPLLQACAPAMQPAPASAPQTAPAEQRAPVTILISIDGFHPSYLDRGITPTMSGLAQMGVRAAMRPSFPSKTFPNHWTLVTGLVPDHHGITANKMEDKARPDEVFTMATLDPYWWSQAKPVWVEAEEAGIRSAAMFWPGSAVPWGGTAQSFGAVTDGVLPSDWQQFSMQVSNTQRVNAVLDWLRRPADIRPEFVTLYFDTVDTAGHKSAPDSDGLNAAVRDVDAHIAMLIEGLQSIGQPANIVIVSDHGMAATSSDRVVVLDDIVDPSLYRLIESGAYATFEPVPGQESAFRKAILADHDHMTCWPKEEIPARYNYGTNDRIPPYFCLADTGWSITRSASDARWTGGNHGYDNFAPEMQAVFIASGPAFREGVSLPVVDNTAVAPLVRKLIGLPRSSQGDGPYDALFPALKDDD